MKKNIVALFVALGILASSASAFAAGTTGMYIAPRLSLIFASKGSSSFGRTDSLGSPSIFGNGSGISLGASFGVAGGYDFQYSASYLPIRVEAEAVFRLKTNELASFSTGTSASDKYEYDQGVGVNTFMIHAYYDIYNSSVFAPYFTIGAGLARVTTNLKLDNIIHEKTESNFAMSGGVGVAWQTELGFNVDLGYRYTYVTSSDVSFSSSNLFSKARPSLHEVTAGIRYVF